jgi:hypothetical protein
MDDPLRQVHVAMANHPTRVPVWIERAEGETSVDELDRHKYLIEKDMTMAQVVYIIRNRIKLDSKHALFIFVGKGVLPANTATVGQTYKEHAGEDYMLHVKYRLEKTFG